MAIVGIIFVALRLHDYSTAIDFARFDMAAWSVVATLALIYGLSNLMLCLAWWNLLGQFGASISRRWAIRAYGMSQIAKYVPGNIFHLAGRQAMGMAVGLSGWSLAKSAVWELGLISATGSLFGLLALPLMVPGLTVTTSTGLFAPVIGIVFVLLWRLIGLPIARAYGWYTVFLTISALLFIALIKLLVVETNGQVAVSWLPLGGAYVLAWLAGLITPGAPAGVGVRELVLLFVLKGVVSEADLLLAVVLGRLVTVAGDLLFFIVSSLMNDRVKNVVN